MPTSRLGGLMLEPLAFSEAFLPSGLDEAVATAIRARAEAIRAYRFFYVSNGHRVEGFLVEPAEGERLPCLVYNRGGSGDVGVIAEEELFMGNISRFAEQGYLCIASQYSGAGRSEGRDEFGGADLDDVLGLYPLLEADPRADARRIGMFGISRGGMMTLLALKRAPWVRAAVLHSPALDHVDATFRPAFQARLTKFMGPSLEARIRRSPLRWVEELPKSVPILLCAGSADWRTNPRDMLRFVDRCYEERIPCRLHWYEGATHALSEVWREAYRESLRWFDRFVRDGEALPNLEPHGR